LPLVALLDSHDFLPWEVHIDRLFVLRAAPCSASELPPVALLDSHDFLPWEVRIDRLLLYLANLATQPFATFDLAKELSAAEADPKISSEPLDLYRVAGC